MISLAFCFTSLLLLHPIPHVSSAPAAILSQSQLPSEPPEPTGPSASLSQVVSPSATFPAPPEQETVPPASNDPNPILWTPDSKETNFEPIRGSLGASVMGPHNTDMERQNADLFIPPSTDAGSVPGSKWPFSLSHNRIQTGGWARQQNIDVMPVATKMASVNMRLVPGAVRELHWHKTAEWAYVLKGTTQVTAVNADGQNYIANVGQGDLWYFPPGIPHSLQATDDDPDGSEFLLVFDDGAFSEDATFMLTDWLSHVPKEVLSNNFQVPISSFDHIPSKGLYIFPTDVPPDDRKAPESPQGTVPEPFTYEFSKQEWVEVPGGKYRIVDSTRNFKVSKKIAAAEVVVYPGGIREMHWHPTQDEWSFFLEGQARVTIFASGENSRTFNYQPGDIGYIPASQGHYVQNVGTTDLKFLEVFNTDKFEDISLNQWLALIPPELVKAHLDLPDDTISKLTKTKVVVQGQTPSSSS